MICLIKNLVKYASQGYRSVIGRRLFISLLTKWGDLCFTAVCRELVCLERALKDDLDNWSNFIPQFLEKKWFELVCTGCLERFQVLKEL